jgi:mono/diheme cytochrome c family protein
VTLALIQRGKIATKVALITLVLMVTNGGPASAGTAPTSPQALALGKQVFLKQCAPCHGATGAGDGEASWLLYPRPRNFRMGKFRLISTWDGVPTDDDLFETITRGIPGS